jgi:hypothetical protein
MAHDDLPDDLDELLDDRRPDLEARFQELERDAEIERIRQQTGAPPPRAQASASPSEDPPAAGDDPLSEMKDAIDSDKELERYLLVLCPKCGAKNRMSLTRVRTAKPICGRCKEDLSFTKF